MNHETFRERVVEDLREYKKNNKVSVEKISRMVGVSAYSVRGWLNGEYKPRDKFIHNMFKAGITKRALSEDRQKEAEARFLKTVDAKNTVEKRPYTRRVLMPDIVKNQIKLLLDDYVDTLDVPMTYSELKQKRGEFITKLYHTCKQGV